MASRGRYAHHPARRFASRPPEPRRQNCWLGLQHTEAGVIPDGWVPATAQRDLKAAAHRREQLITAWTREANGIRVTCQRAGVRMRTGEILPQARSSGSRLQNQWDRHLLAYQRVWYRNFFAVFTRTWYTSTAKSMEGAAVHGDQAPEPDLSNHEEECDGRRSPGHTPPHATAYGTAQRGASRQNPALPPGIETKVF